MYKEFTTLPDFVKVIKMGNGQVEYQMECPKCHKRYILVLTNTQHDNYLAYWNNVKASKYNHLLSKKTLKSYMRMLDYEYEYRLTKGVCQDCYGHR